MSWKVRAAKPGMSATYTCPTAEAALAQVRYFARKDYRTLTITAPDGAEVTTVALEALVTSAQADAASTFSDEPVRA